MRERVTFLLRRVYRREKAFELLGIEAKGRSDTKEVVVQGYFCE